MQIILNNGRHLLNCYAWTAASAFCCFGENPEWAIPHWFDKAFLDALLQKSLSNEDFETLKDLSYVEKFERGLISEGYALENGYNVHELTRNLLLEKLWQDQPERYRELNRRAAEYCANKDQKNTIWRIEYQYHSLLAAVDSYHQIGDSLGEANHIKALGDVHIQLSEYDAARVRYEEVLLIYRQIGNRLGEANCIFRFGLICKETGDTDKAIEFLKEAAQCFRNIGLTREESACLKIIAEIERLRQDSQDYLK